MSILQDIPEIRSLVINPVSRTVYENIPKSIVKSLHLTKGQKLIVKQDRDRIVFSPLGIADGSEDGVV